MGEEVRGVPEAAALEVAQAAQDSIEGSPEASVGVYLARQRRLRSISLDELSALTRIPRRSLERLEQGAFDRAPDGFARGFVRSVAEALGLDADEAVMRLLPEPPASRARGVRGLRARPEWLLALALAVAIAAGAGAWWRLRDRPAPGADTRVELPAMHRRDAVRELAAEARRTERGKAPASR